MKADSKIVDLRKSPFNADADKWLHAKDYSYTQEFSQVARKANIGGIIYQSVRDPQPSWCIALLTPLGFSKSKPRLAMQTWWLAVHQDEVIWRRDSEFLTFSFSTGQKIET